ncbi:MAG: hypothetical protein GX623_06610 [Clostridiales bacterium]|nr:hypothetical protein [Clostridiales bacterium]
MMQTRTFSAPAPARRRRSPEWEEKRKPYEQLLKARDIDDKTAMTSMARRLTMLQAIRPIPPDAGAVPHAPWARKPRRLPAAPPGGTMVGNERLAGGQGSRKKQG